MKIVDFSSPEGQSGAKICFQEARKLREKEIKGATRKLREKKSSKMRQRERPEAPEEPRSHGLSTLSTFQSFHKEDNPDMFPLGRTRREPRARSRTRL